MRKPSPALVISLVALFVALGGTSYAAIRLPKNSIGTKQLKDGAVTRSKISSGTISSLRGQTGPQGPQGIQGPRGLQGVQGVKGNTGAPGQNGTARAWAVVDNVGNISHSHNVTTVVKNGTGDYCVELDPSVPNSSTAAILTPYFADDTTAGNDITHLEYDGPCAPNGVRVLAYEVQASTTLSATQTDQGFFIAVP
jgi:hypothetical protein